MITDPTNRLHSRPGHTGYGEYDSLTGYLVGTMTRQRYDRRRGCTIITEYEVINLGRPDRGIPVDTEAQMEPEDWGMEERHALAAPFGEMIPRIVAVLQRCGVSTTGDIAAALGRRNSAIQNTLVRRSDLFVRVSGGGKRGVPSTWGLVGLHDKEAEADGIR